MPSTLISAASTNWLTDTTWKLADPTAESDTVAANAALTTSYVGCTAFTPGAIEIDAIAVRLASKAASPTGTMSVELYNSTDVASVAGTEVVINVADLPTASTTNLQGGWIVFAFAAPVTLIALKAYQVRAKTSSASMVNLHSAATTNWARELRTTTAQAPGAGDKLLICGEHTGAGTGNDIAVVMNETATTDYGTASTTLPSVSISKRGTLAYGYSGSTNYLLRISGLLVVNGGGTFTMGTVAHPIPITSTAVLEFDCAADGDFGLVVKNEGTCTIQGVSRTALKSVVQCKLNTDEAIAQTVLGVNADTGWLTSDEICIAPTSRTYSEYERRTLAGAATATEVTVTAGLTYAHSGTSPTQAEVGLLTHNCKVRSVTSTLMAYVNVKATATVDVDWCEFYYLGKSTTGKRGIEIETTAGGSSSIRYFSIHDCEEYGIYVTGAAHDAWSVRDGVFYLAATAAGSSFVNATTTGTSYTLKNILVIACTSPTVAVAFADIMGTIADITVAGCVTGSGLAAINITDVYSKGGSIGTLTSHSNDVYGIQLTRVQELTISSVIVWRNASNGLYLSGSAQGTIITTILAFGNNTNILGYSEGATINGGIVAGDAYGSVRGISNAVGYALGITLNNVKLGQVSGIYLGHTTADIGIGSPARMFLNNCLLASTAEIDGQSTIDDGGYVRSSDHDQVPGAFKTWKRQGTISSDTVLYRSASKSERLTPLSASLKLESGSRKCSVPAANTVTVTCYVRKSAVADPSGADYNGAQPRLVLKASARLGVASDTVLATAAGALGAWEVLTATTPAAAVDGVFEFVVDCDGTAGWVNVDDWSVV